MKKLDILFVRACKSQDPHTRLASLYRRKYLKNGKPMGHIANILARICDAHVPFTAVELLAELSPSNAWKLSGEYDFTEIALYVTMNKIRFADMEKFPGFIPGAKWRKMFAAKAAK